MDFTIHSRSTGPAVMPSSPRAATPAPVPTQLPPSQSVAAANSTSAVRNDVSPAVSARASEVVIDHEAAAIVYQVVDTSTDQVISQFPEEVALRRRADFNALDRAKSSQPKNFGDGWIA